MTLGQVCSPLALVDDLHVFPSQVPTLLAFVAMKTKLHTMWALDQSRGHTLVCSPIIVKGESFSASLAKLSTLLATLLCISSTLGGGALCSACMQARWGHKHCMVANALCLSALCDLDRPCLEGHQYAAGLHPWQLMRCINGSQPAIMSGKHATVQHLMSKTAIITFPVPWTALRKSLLPGRHLEEGQASCVQAGEQCDQTLMGCSRGCSKPEELC